MFLSRVTSGLSIEGIFCVMTASHIHFTIMSIALISDLKKKRLDPATYCLRTHVFEAIGAILVGPKLFFIGGM